MSFHRSVKKKWKDSWAISFAIKTTKNPLNSNSHIYPGYNAALERKFIWYFLWGGRGRNKWNKDNKKNVCPLGMTDCCFCVTVKWRKNESTYIWHEIEGLVKEIFPSFIHWVSFFPVFNNLGEKYPLGVIWYVCFPIRHFILLRRYKFEFVCNQKVVLEYSDVQIINGMT